MKKLFKILLTSTLLALVLGGCEEADKTMSEENKDSTSSQSAQKDKKFINIEKINNIILNKMSDNIKIYYHNDSAMLFKAENIDDYAYQNKDGTLEITSNKKEETVGNVIIFLPKKDYNELRITNKNAATKIFDIRAYTLGIYSDNEVVVDNTELNYLRLSTKNKVVITKSTIKNLSAETDGSNKIIIDKVKFEKGLLKTDTGDILANFLGSKSSYNISSNVDELNKDEKALVTVTNGGAVSIKFL